MNTWLAGVAGLAMTAFTGSAIAQETGVQPAEPAQASTPVDAAAPLGQPAVADNAENPSTEATAPQTDTAQSSAAPDASGAAEASVAAWEGEIPNAYLGTRAPVPTTELEAFLEQPRLFLDNNPEGGRTMAQSVRSLVNTDNRTVAAVVSMVKMPDVRDAQVGAAAEGLAAAMRDAEAAAPRYAAYIQWAVATSGSKELIAAFERSSGSDEDRTAAIGAGGSAGGAPGSGSLSGGGTPGPSGSAGSTSTVATNGGLTGGRGGGASISFDEGDSLLGASGRLIVCNLDASPAGCSVPF